MVYKNIISTTIYKNATANKKNQGVLDTKKKITFIDIFNVERPFMWPTPSMAFRNNTVTIYLRPDYNLHSQCYTPLQAHFSQLVKFYTERIIRHMSTLLDKIYI
ncbi:hypothetical protein GDO81_014098 [Engystomops pustulosus]|uniref:Uncharacterized protein n=1 Tax=Engystomops pustulosus TaxID=76066 RepID=A0AAV7B808_ENGPU|nr:hypothetical protein GDO81_014098 [Engystomops pustulosus]